MNTAGTIIAVALLMSGDGEAPESFVDSDNDGVQDFDDLCPGSDDTVDLNTNDIPDCSETFGPNLMFDDEQSIDAMTIAPTSNGIWVGWDIGHDGNGWSESGSLWLYSFIAQFGSMASVCVDVPLYYDYLGLWYHARTAGPSPDMTAVLVYHEYDAKGCAGQATITTVYPGVIESSYQIPWAVLHDELDLAGATRSVLVDFIATTDDPWMIDNILLLPRIASEQDDGPPPQD
jgi:hypothetical protein